MRVRLEEKMKKKKEKERKEKKNTFWTPSNPSLKIRYLRRLPKTISVSKFVSKFTVFCAYLIPIYPIGCEIILSFLCVCLLWYPQLESKFTHVQGYHISRFLHVCRIGQRVFLKLNYTQIINIVTFELPSNIKTLNLNTRETNYCLILRGYASENILGFFLKYHDFSVYVFFLIWFVIFIQIFRHTIYLCGLVKTFDEYML